MSALGKRVLDLAEQQGLLDGKAITELRKKVAESKFVISPEAIAKVLVDHGHLTPFQARKVVAQALENEAGPVEPKVAERPKAKPKPPVEDLTLAEDRPARRPKADASEEIVDLEAVEQSPRQPSGQGPSSGQANSAGATADDFVDLEAVEPAPSARGQRWKTDPQPLNETIEMSPLDVPQSAEVVDLEPIDDLFGPDPFAAPQSSSARPTQPPAAATNLQAALPSADIFGQAPTPARPQAARTAPRRKAAKNVWDSPLLLIGGGLLGVVLIAFFLLFYALTRGTAAEMFTKAEDEYRNGSFTAAIAIYNQFLEKYPQDANASLARVRRGMATLRQITEGGKNPPLALETAQQVLPEIEAEEKFGEARAELASILPDIADGVTERAVQAEEPARKEEWVKRATEALALVNNPSYLPASLRKERENHISRIVDKLKVAERGIEQDRQLATTVEQILAAADKGQAAMGYELRETLLRTYPGLESNRGLTEAIAKLGQRERELVKVSQGGPAPFRDDHPTPGKQIILWTAAGTATAGATPVVLLLEGAVYGIDPSTGRLLWRRHVGYETTVEPLVISTNGQMIAAIVDGRRQELVLVDAASGQFRWRHMLGDRVIGLAASGSRIIATTRKGRITSIDTASGDIVGSAQLPQGALVGPAVRQSRLFQLGEHSTLFVLESDTLKCTQTVYLGHKAGSVLVPPVAVVEHLIFIESPADDYSLLHVLAADAKTKQYAVAGQSRRLKGRVVRPPAISGSRFAVTTDLGQIQVFQIEGGSSGALRSIAGAAATETGPLTTYAELDQNRLFVAGRRRTMYEVQEALEQLALKWTENQDDRFVAPLGLHGDILVVARRRVGVSGVLVEGCNAATGQSLWTTPVAAPIAALIGSDSQQTVVALTGNGRLYELNSKTFDDGRAGESAFDSKAEGILDAGVSADGHKLAWNRPNASRAFVYDTVTRGAGRTITLPAAAAATAIPTANGVVAPLVDGRVAWLSSDSSASKVGPFLPPLVPDALPLWSKPLPLSDGKSFLISDGRDTVYAVTLQEGVQPRLIASGQTKASGPVRSLAWMGTAAVGVLQKEAADAIVGLDAEAKAAFAEIPLAGRVRAGPFSVGGLALLAAEPDGLVCIDGEGKIRWKQDLARGPLAGAPLALADEDLLVAYQSGDLCRINPADGQLLAVQSIEQPLLGPACLLGPNVYLSGCDGVVHRITVPSRQ